MNEKKGCYSAASGSPKLIIEDDKEFNKKLETVYYMIKAINIIRDCEEREAKEEND
jgi:hypothetical protein